MTGYKQGKETSAFQESWACPRRQAGHRAALWGDAAGGDGSVPHITLQIQTPPAIPSYTSGWQKEAEAAIPKALSFCFVLGMHQETTSPPAGTSDPGERRFTPWVAPMLLPWRSRLPTPQLGKRVRWWQWPQSAFSHHLPELASRHPLKKKGLIIRLPAFREFCIQLSTLGICSALAPQAPYLPSAPYAQAAVHQPWNSSPRFHHPDWSLEPNGSLIGTPQGLTHHHLYKMS